MVLGERADGGGEKFALAMTAGVVAGVGINAAHELGHKSEKLEKWLAKVALAQSFYGHFYVEHNHGHHVRVATPEDPASSRYKENFWFFLPRSVVGGLRSGWRIESARLRRQRRRTWSYRNNILNAWAMSVVLFGSLIAAFGWEIAPWLAVQAIAGFTFLETANYLEHYACYVRSGLTARTSGARPRTAGTATTSSAICSSINFSVTATITRIRVCGTRACEVRPKRRNFQRVTQS